MMGKKCCNSNVFIRIFRLLLRMVIMIMEWLKKAKKVSFIILNNQKYERYNK